MYKHFLKRLIDIVLSFMGIVVLAVPMLIIAVIIKIDSPGPVLFKQTRVGKGQKPFTILKFRSMPVSAPRDVATHQLDTSKIELTGFQRALRASSLDELPQLFNIFVSDISIVGPRPCLPTQHDLIAEREKYGANDIKPGLTGLAQINGRDELEIAVKARFDGQYTEALNSGHGFKMDLRCFFGTVTSVLKRDGVREGGTGEKETQKETVKK